LLNGLITTNNGFIFNYKSDTHYLCGELLRWYFLYGAIVHLPYRSLRKRRTRTLYIAPTV